VLPEFAYGSRGRASCAGRAPDNQVVIDVESGGKPATTTDTGYTTRSPGEVVGWRVMCDCREDLSSTRITDTWTSELVARVPSQALADPLEWRLFALDDDVVEVDDLHTSELQATWRPSMWSEPPPESVPERSARTPLRSAQRPQERKDVVGEDFGLLVRGEVSTSGWLRPTHDAVGALGHRPRDK
jgi:hypothetical protein